MLGENLAMHKVLSYYNLTDADYVRKEKYKILCPFHPDVNASLLVDNRNDTWYCFGCQRRGNAFDFVKEVETKLNDFDIYKKYYKIINNSNLKSDIQFERKTPEQIVIDLKHDLIVAKDYYYNLKQTNWKEVDNVEKEYLLKRGFILTTLQKSGAKLTYNTNYPIVFPMRDLGQFRGYVCRTMNSEIEKKRKYLYNKSFSRNTTLVGNYKNKVVILVEGYFDYLKAKQLGVDYVCAILGWKITTAQIQKLKEIGVKKIISALDDDDCGRAGTEILKKHFKTVTFRFPKGCKDLCDISSRQQYEKARIKTKKMEAKKNGTIKKY